MNVQKSFENTLFVVLGDQMLPFLCLCNVDSQQSRLSQSCQHPKFSQINICAVLTDLFFSVFYIVG